jgi:hypothetical protein
MMATRDPQPLLPFLNVPDAIELVAGTTCIGTFPQRGCLADERRASSVATIISGVAMTSRGALRRTPWP